MRLVPFDKKKHYPALVNVWEHYNLTPYPPADYLPGIGYVMEKDNGNFVAALFMYLIQDEAAFIDWGASDPNCERQLKQVAFEILMNNMVVHASLAGAKFIYSISKIKPFLDMLSANGMSVAETGMTTMVMPLDKNNMSFIKD